HVHAHRAAAIACGRARRVPNVTFSFSSRRRHTRCYRDWSSDVCSSDLEIVFPAGILQPPFFYANADDAVNYGAIGAVIGHEMTHGFDDQGRQFDAKGNLRDWWTPKSAEEFEKRSAAIVQQYNEYEPLPGLHSNGELTQGENIADIGGVKLAYAALQKALDKHPEERAKKI